MYMTWARVIQGGYDKESGSGELKCMKKYEYITWDWGGGGEYIIRGRGSEK